MKKYELYRKEERIIRVLEIRTGKVLVIDCIKRIMPVWMKTAALDSFDRCGAEELYEVTGNHAIGIDFLDAEQKKVMYERYTMISAVLPVLADERRRSEMIRLVAAENHLTGQTVRKYLCTYLAYMDMGVLAPAKRTFEKDSELSVDQKNMRWALNKFFYTTQKHSLMTAYTMMLKEKYCNSLGVLSEVYPSFYQFRYFYRKTKKMQNYYISRDGLTNYQRNNRPLTGNGVQQFAPMIGTGMLDATVCDIYLVDEAGNLVGRPILTACIDAYSGLCCGYFLSWEGGVYSLRGLMLNVVSDKAEWCRQFGIRVETEQWACQELPGILVTDMGSEYKSENFEQIAELGVKVVNLPPYRPELKGTVEKFFDLIQREYKKHLKGKGVIEPDFQERGAHDYRKDACLTMEDFEKVILYCILYYNSQRIIENFPYTKEMLEEKVEPHASDIWNWSAKQMGANLIKVEKEVLMLTLLPRTTGIFSRHGLKVNKLRYHCEGYTDEYLRGGEVTVAYNPEDVTRVWLSEHGIYTEFTLTESRFQGKNLTEVQEMQIGQRELIRSLEQENLQAQIDLAGHIEGITGNIKRRSDVAIQNIRDNRKREQDKKHFDYMRGGRTL